VSASIADVAPKPSVSSSGCAPTTTISGQAARSSTGSFRRALNQTCAGVPAPGNGRAANRAALLTGGSNGKGPARGDARLIPPSWLPLADAGRLARPLWVFCLLVVIATVLFVLARNGVHSRAGRALVAVRDNEASARASGIDVARYKAVAFALSAAYGGIAGGMLMMNRPFASEVQFGTRVAIFLVVGVVLGGAGTIAGAIPGAIAYVFVPYFVSGWSVDPSGLPPVVRQVTKPLFDWLRPAGSAAAGIFFGLLLLVLVFLLPGGFVDGLRRVRARVITIEPNPPWMVDVRPPGADVMRPVQRSRNTLRAPSSNPWYTR